MLLNRQRECGMYTVIHREEDDTEEKRPGFVCVSLGLGTDGLSFSSVISLTLV